MTQNYLKVEIGLKICGNKININQIKNKNVLKIEEKYENFDKALREIDFKKRFQGQFILIEDKLKIYDKHIFTITENLFNQMEDYLFFDRKNYSKYRCYILSNNIKKDEVYYIGKIDAFFNNIEQEINLISEKNNNIKKEDILNENDFILSENYEGTEISYTKKELLKILKYMDNDDDTLFFRLY